MMRKRLKIERLELIMLVFIIGLENLYGIPAFVRKYVKHRQTCYVSEPKLNGFGELFRTNGYQMPGVRLAMAPFINDSGNIVTFCQWNAGGNICCRCNYPICWIYCFRLSSGPYPF